MKIKTNVKASGLQIQHNQTMARGLKVNRRNNAGLNTALNLETARRSSVVVGADGSTCRQLRALIKIVPSYQQFRICFSPV